MKMNNNYFNRRYLAACSLFLLFLILLTARRWEQVVDTQVWAEEGTRFLFGFINNDWKAFFQPVQGYFQTISKIITYIAFKTSFYYYPYIATTLSFLFTASVGLAIAFAPTRLRGKTLCAISVFLVPLNPEVFGTSFLAFWWTSLLLFLVVLWDEKRTDIAWRVFFVLIGGLSSPVIVLVTPFLIFRAWWYKSRREIFIAATASCAMLIQLFCIIKNSAGKFPPIHSLLINVIPKFFGMLLVGNWDINISPIWLWAAGLFVIALVCAWFFRQWKETQSWALLYLLLGSIALTVSRLDPAVIHPVCAGPRYFFFTFILLFWIFIQCYYSFHSILSKAILGIAVILIAVNLPPAWTRSHGDRVWLNQWKNHVISSRLFPKYRIPIVSDGTKTNFWSLRMTGEATQMLLAKDPFVSLKEIDGLPTYPYTIIKNITEKRCNEKVTLVKRSIIGTDSQKSKMENYAIVGTYSNSDADTGEISVKLHRGSCLYYRSGSDNSGLKLVIEGSEQKYLQALPAAVEWSTLDFSNSQLPAEFIATFKDEDKNFGQWLALAIKD